MNKIEVRSKDPTKISVGANTEIYINDVKAKLVKSFKYEVDARGVGVATVEYYGNISIESNLPNIVVNSVEPEDCTVQEVGDYNQQHICGEQNE